MSAGFTFFPTFVAGAAEEHHLPETLRFAQRICIHEAEHQDVAASFVLNNGRHQPATFLKVDLHLCPPEFPGSKNKKPAWLFMPAGRRVLCLAVCYAHLSGRGMWPP